MVTLWADVVEARECGRFLDFTAARATCLSVDEKGTIEKLEEAPNTHVDVQLTLFFFDSDVDSKHVAASDKKTYLAP